MQTQYDPNTGTISIPDCTREPKISTLPSDQHVDEPSASVDGPLRDKQQVSAAASPAAPTIIDRTSAWLRFAGSPCAVSPLVRSEPSAQGLSQNQVVHELQARMTRPPSPVNEIEQAVAKVYESVPDPHSRTRTSAPKWPPVNQDLREAVIARGLGLVDLHQASPVPCGGLFPQTEQIIDALFPGNPPLCVGRNKWDFVTRRREVFRGHLSRQQLIVPSPMIAPYAKAQAATGERHYLVVEQDSGNLDEQAAVVLHLSVVAPLVMALNSGSKSLHSWFFCKGHSKDRLLSFMRNAVALGANKATWTRSRFVRMPDAMRDNGRRQTVVFFNPEAGR